MRAWHGPAPPAFTRVCDARPMEPVLVAVIGALAAALALAARRLRARDAAFARLSERLSARSSSEHAVAAAAERIEARSAAAEERIAALAADLEFLGSLLATGYLHLDADQRVDLANPAAHAMLDVAPGRLVGRTVMEAFLDARVEDLVAAASGGGGSTAEVTRGARGSQRLVALARRSPTRGTWVILDDVSELRRLQQIRAEFIDNLSHELRTPLSNVSLLAETLAAEAKAAAVPDRMRDRIGKIEVETGHLVQMVNELLDLSRIEGGTSLVMRDDVDVAALARSSVERLRLFAERQGVTLRTEVADGMPSIRGDEDRLGQVLVNLVHNAVKFSPEGGDVTVHVRLDGDQVELAVEDHGIGIPRADRPRIFERFYKVDRARVRGGGTGLGLAIARHVVEGHGGRIWVESEERSGSTFRFTLPIHAPEAAQVAPARIP